MVMDPGLQTVMLVHEKMNYVMYMKKLRTLSHELCKNHMNYVMLVSAKHKILPHELCNVVT